MTFLRTMVPLAVLMVAAMWPCAAQAGNPYVSTGGYHYVLPWLGAGVGGGHFFGTSQVPVPPYYALHPPVYYGQRVARPYGLSPFAHLPTVPPKRMAPPALFADAPREAVRPELITNPFYEPEEQSEEIEAGARQLLIFSGVNLGGLGRRVKGHPGRVCR